MPLSVPTVFTNANLTRGICQVYPSGDIWVGGIGYVWRYRSNGTSLHFSLGTAAIGGICWDGSYLWAAETNVGSGAKVWKIHPVTGPVASYVVPNASGSICLGGDGNLWCTTEWAAGTTTWQGVTALTPLGTIAHTYTVTSGSSALTASNSHGITSEATPTYVYVVYGGFQDAYKVAMSSGVVTTWSLSGGAELPAAILRDGSDIWIADYNLAMWHVNPSTGATTKYPVFLEPSGICLAPDNYLYICTADGYVYRFDPVTHAFTEVCYVLQYAFGKPLDICAGPPVGVPGAVYVGALTVPTSYPTVWTVAPGYVMQVPVIG